MAQAIRQAIVAVDNAIEFGKREPPEVIAARQALVALQHALEAYDIYGMNAKRLRASLELEKERLAEILAQLVALPVTPDEKVLARKARIEQRSGGHRLLQDNGGEVKGREQLEKGARPPAAKGKAQQDSKVETSRPGNERGVIKTGRPASKR